MEDLFRETIFDLQNQQFEDHKNSFLRIFQRHKLQPEDKITEQQWIFDENYSPDSLEVLNYILGNCQNQTVGEFVDECINEIKKLHFQLLECKFDLEKLKKTKFTLEEIKTKLFQEDAEDNLQIYETNNHFNIFYYQDNNFNKEIFNFYKQKYKVSMDNVSFYGIHFEKHRYQQNQNKKNSDNKKQQNFEFYFEEMENIYLKIIGKKIQNQDFQLLQQQQYLNNQQLQSLPNFQQKYQQEQYKQLKEEDLEQNQTIISENYQTTNTEFTEENYSQIQQSDYVQHNIYPKKCMEIAQIKFSFQKIYELIQLEHYLKNFIPAVYIELTYQDNNADAPFKGDNHIGLCIDFKISIEQRQKIVEQLFDKHENDIQLLEKAIKQKKHAIQNILHPFEEFIQYDEQSGITPLNDRMCLADQQNCTIM